MWVGWALRNDNSNNRKMTGGRMEMKLVQESEWMRVFSAGPNQLRYESKFLRNEVQISAEEIKQRWTSLSSDKQMEFAVAFSANPTWSEEDARVLEFLMAVGNDYVVQTLADLIARRCERQRAQEFLLGRIEGAGSFPRSNYYRVLGTIGDRDSLPQLRQIYNEYSEELKGSKNRLLAEFSGYIDYLYLCATLRQLDGSPEFERAIRAMLDHSDESVRTCAQRLGTGPA
jgi:hypothetical protein